MSARYLSLMRSGVRSSDWIESSSLDFGFGCQVEGPEQRRAVHGECRDGDLVVCHASAHTNRARSLTHPKGGPSFPSSGKAWVKEARIGDVMF